MATRDSAEEEARLAIVFPDKLSFDGFAASPAIMMEAQRNSLSSQLMNKFPILLLLYLTFLNISDSMPTTI